MTHALISHPKWLLGGSRHVDIPITKLGGSGPFLAGTINEEKLFIDYLILLNNTRAAMYSHIVVLSVLSR